MSALEEHGNIISLSLNQDHGCFTCSMDSGVRIYNIEPLAEHLHLKADKVGSIAKCEMVDRTNMTAIVGGGQKQTFADNAVLIYDDSRGKIVLEFTFPFPVKAVKLRRDRLYVATMNHIHVFSFPNNAKKLVTYDTRDNPRGILEVSPFQTSEQQLLVYPGYKTGSLQIINLSTTEPSASVPTTISAHQNDIVSATLNSQGTLLATASTEGTLIRIFDTYSGALVTLLRRGTDSATIYCINFSQDSEYLCASSDKGTIHIFALKNTQLNKRSLLSNIGVINEGLRAFATFTVAAECECICAFGSHSSVYAICVDGTFHKYIFGKDGKCNRVAFDIFLDMCEEDDW